MGEIKTSSNYTLIISIAVLTAIFTSLPWFYFYNQNRQLLAVTNDSNAEQTKTLENQLAQQMTLNRNLMNNLADIQEARVTAENELGEFSEKLRQTEEELSLMNDMDWELKYRFAMLGNESLVEEIAALEFRHEENIEQLAEDYNLILATKNYIEEDFIKLEFKYDDLLEADNNLKEKYLGDMQLYAEETENLQSNLKKITKELENKNRLVAELRKENEKVKNKLAQNKEIISPKNEKPKEIAATANITKANNTDNSKDFRAARIKSLSAAMLNRNSEERKNILISVIPNIPEGVTGRELSSLVQGMNSGDILYVIKSTKPHINRPLENDAFNQLIKTMNKQDAALAGNLLSSE